MFPPVYELLHAAAPVRALLGDSPTRVYGQGNAPQDTTKPYATWFLVSAVPENTLSELPSHDRMPVQIDLWHQTEAGVRQLAQVVRDALEPSAHMTSVLLTDRDAATKLYRVALQFDFWVAR